MELVYIEWEDASACDEHGGWIDRPSAPEPIVHVFKQVGFVYSIDLHAVVLTEAYTDVAMSPRTRIPLGMIRRWVDLDEYVKAPA